MVTEKLQEIGEEVKTKSIKQLNHVDVEEKNILPTKEQIEEEKKLETKQS